MNNNTDEDPIIAGARSWIFEKDDADDADLVPKVKAHFLDDTEALGAKDEICTETGEGAAAGAPATPRAPRLGAAALSQVQAGAAVPAPALGGGGGPAEWSMCERSAILASAAATQRPTLPPLRSTWRDN